MTDRIRPAHVGPDGPGASAQLRRALDVMFPPAYLKLFHQPPHSVCSLLALKLRPNLNANEDERADDCEASSEPSSRFQVLQLRESLEDSLAEHRAKATGLCPVRRAIYDQLFDELIRQTTVGCVEQGLLLFRVRNELRLTLSCYRRAYESAVSYGLRRALDASLAVAQSERVAPRPQAVRQPSQQPPLLQPTGTQDERVAEGARRLEEKLRDYYQGELAKRDEVIAQQQAILRAISLKAPDLGASP